MSTGSIMGVETMLMDEVADVLKRQHKSRKTTMIYTHCMLPAGEAGVVSPLDKIFQADVI